MNNITNSINKATSVKMPSTKTDKIYLTIVLLLMVVTGLIIYYMYFRPEQFINRKEHFAEPNITDPIITVPIITNPTITFSNSACPQLPPQIPSSILSRYFGIGFNITAVNNASNSSSTLYLIEHIPLTSTGTAGGMYAISDDGRLTIKVQNNQDSSQWWSMSQITDSKDNTSYYIVQPFTSSSTPFALQYENGNIAIRPYVAPGFEGQRWITSQNKITRGIPVLNYSPGSLFTAEFDPYASTSSGTTDTLSDSNSKQVSDVVNAVKSGIQQYLAQAASSQSNGQISSSSLGNKTMPLNVNLNLSGASKSNVSGFANVDGSTSDFDILSMLDKYEYSSSLASTGITPNSQTGCKQINLNDYTSSRVSSCNCKL